VERMVRKLDQSARAGQWRDQAQDRGRRHLPKRRSHRSVGRLHLA
jgi:hypothetical protein